MKNLTILGAGGSIIREIEFTLGLNLVIDDTPSDIKIATGNSVGKTTVLKLVDFCLGGNAKIIYTDPENPKIIYNEVKDFLVDNEVRVVLRLKSDLEDPRSIELKIERNFLARAKAIRRINGDDFTEKEFELKLVALLFPGHNHDKPTVRQLISHNIRHSDSSINNTLKTLHTLTTLEEYEALYLYMFGCPYDQADEKLKLTTKLQVESAFKKRLEKDETKSGYVSRLAIVEREIDLLDTRKGRMNLSSHLSDGVEKLREVRFRMSTVSSDIGRLSLRREMIAEASCDIRSSRSEINTHQLRSIYDQAKLFVGELPKTFESLLNFHNNMIAEKISFIEAELPALDQTISSKQGELAALLAEEAQVNASMTASEPFADFEIIINHLNSRHAEKGQFETIIAQISEVDSAIGVVESGLSNIEDYLFSADMQGKIQEQLNTFTKFFSEVSEELYGEKFALKFDIQTKKNGKKVYVFSAFNTTNFSSGKKQGEISCFDIAYTLFADDQKIPCLHFLLNDKKELMHDNQLVKIASLVQTRKVQFVAAILRDKLPPELLNDDYFAVVLSQNDKLFRIEASSGLA